MVAVPSSICTSRGSSAAPARARARAAPLRAAAERPSRPSRRARPCPPWGISLRTAAARRQAPPPGGRGGGRFGGERLGREGDPAHEDRRARIDHEDIADREAREQAAQREAAVADPHGERGGVGTNQDIGGARARRFQGPPRRGAPVPRRAPTWNRQLEHRHLAAQGTPHRELGFHADRAREPLQDAGAGARDLVRDLATERDAREGLVARERADGRERELPRRARAARDRAASRVRSSGRHGAQAPADEHSTPHAHPRRVPEDLGAGARHRHEGHPRERHPQLSHGPRLSTRDAPQGVPREARRGHEPGIAQPAPNLTLEQWQAATNGSPHTQHRGESASVGR